MRCKTCNKEKSEDGFYKSNKNKCKDCVKACVNANRQENLERIRSYDRLRGSMPHRVAARKEYQATPAGIASRTASAIRWASAHPERRASNIIVGNALRDGRLEKTPCQVCGEKKVEGHHPDYSQPLNVVWLCNLHHREIHAMEVA
jgi:hypothetical protein